MRLTDWLDGSIPDRAVKSDIPKLVIIESVMSATIDPRPRSQEPPNTDRCERDRDADILPNMAWPS
jgi:hypothetical protein